MPADCGTLGDALFAPETPAGRKLPLIARCASASKAAAVLGPKNGDDSQRIQIAEPRPTGMPTARGAIQLSTLSCIITPTPSTEQHRPEKK